MNDNHLQQIFANYISNFETLNNSEHAEYYKWQVAKNFRGEMDEALTASDEDFSKKLYEVRKHTENLIDNYTQPFYGLVKFAEKEPDTVRNMFKELFSDDSGSIAKKQAKVDAFLQKSHELKDKYYPGSYLYRDTFNSVTGYLFLYDPDNNYIYKATNARNLADCAEFYDDWGAGMSVKLDVYYKMCNRLVEKIKDSKELMEVDAKRFSGDFGVNPETLHPDPEKHILACDLIYCCSAYNLLEGIPYLTPFGGKRRLLQEKVDKAKELYDEYETARKKLENFNIAAGYVNSVFSKGAKLRHKKYGKGTVKENDGEHIVVRFSKAGQKKLSTIVSAANDIIISDDPDYETRMEEYREYLKKDKAALESVMNFAGKQLEPYENFLDI